MKRVLAMILTTAVLLYTAPLFAADAAAGKELYGKKCATCHGAEGEGKASIAKTMKVELRHLGSKEVQTKTDANLKKDILEGTGKMKPITGIDAKAGDDLVAYMRTLAKK
jgi:cytochrome c553